MLCKKCPHLVRHGKSTPEGDIEFESICALIVKAETLESGPEAMTKGPGRRGPRKAAAAKPMEIKPEHRCNNYPFPKVFDYMECTTYQGTFKSSTRKNDVVPTKDFQYSDALSGSSLTDMELL